MRWKIGLRSWSWHDSVVQQCSRHVTHSLGADQILLLVLLDAGLWWEIAPIPQRCWYGWIWKISLDATGLHHILTHPSFLPNAKRLRRSMSKWTISDSKPKDKKHFPNKASLPCLCCIQNSSFKQNWNCQPKKMRKEIQVVCWRTK